LSYSFDAGLIKKLRMEERERERDRTSSTTLQINKRKTPPRKRQLLFLCDCLLRISQNTDKKQFFVTGDLDYYRVCSTQRMEL